MTAKFLKTAIMSTAALAAAGIVQTAAADDNWAYQPAPVMQGSLNVEVKRPHVLRLPMPASAVVVGDPEVADVAIHSTDTLLVLGRSYGVTNLIAMDASGRVILNQDIVVTEPYTNSTVRVYNGAEDRRSYHCAPDCLPAPSLGDNGRFAGAFRQGARPLNNQVATSSASGEPLDFDSGDMSASSLPPDFVPSQPSGPQQTLLPGS